MEKAFLRTKELAALLGVAPTTLANLDGALGLNAKAGQGIDRVYTFENALVVAVYVELSQTMSYATAREVAAELGLQWASGDFMERPVAIIRAGRPTWVSADNVDAAFQQALLDSDPLTTIYTIPLERVRGFFDADALVAERSR